MTGPGRHRGGQIVTVMQMFMHRSRVWCEHISRTGECQHGLVERSEWALRYVGRHRR